MKRKIPKSSNFVLTNLFPRHILQQGMGISSSESKTVDSGHASVPGVFLSDHMQSLLGQGRDALTRYVVVQVGWNVSSAVCDTHLKKQMKLVPLFQLVYTSLLTFPYSKNIFPDLMWLCPKLLGKRSKYN